MIAFIVVSCAEDVYDDSSEDVLEPVTMYIGFTINMESNPKGLDPMSKSLITHTYEKHGYKVIIQGAIAGGQLILTDVDLTEVIELKATGDIYITVEHPNFNKSDLATIAYFGTIDYRVQLENEGISAVELELVQGFVMVIAEGKVEDKIRSIRISGESAQLDVVYYIDVPKVEVDVDLGRGGDLSGEHDTVLGEGVVYEVVDDNGPGRPPGGGQYNKTDFGSDVDSDIIEGYTLVKR